jgi:hypothetical protein
VALVCTDASEERIASIVNVERISELETCFAKILKGDCDFLLVYAVLLFYCSPAFSDYVFTPRRLGYMGIVFDE